MAVGGCTCPRPRTRPVVATVGERAGEAKVAVGAVEMVARGEAGRGEGGGGEGGGEGLVVVLGHAILPPLIIRDGRQRR
ncbi:hypothetical protein CYMTET_46062 [Cymbomonas tetramitiformis]|uniref:Uncharacterized protein n=1 Tax=Cymbomonas tetramitiformis TaxID=36881 RepID=A0AAE0BWZ3_9CHLO|nr:hypothetical protein CYMTET_46062 [Cymbomonas tetramitiformis]